MSNSSDALKLTRDDAESASEMLGQFPHPRQLQLLADSDQGITGDGLRKSQQGPGRRPGSKGRRSGKLADLIHNKFGDLLMHRIEMGLMDTATLTAALRAADQPDRDKELDRIMDAVAILGDNCTKAAATKLANALAKFLSRKEISALDVWKEQLSELKDATTYQHGRQPLSIDVSTRKDAYVFIPGVNAPADMSPKQLGEAVERDGTEAIDMSGMKVVEQTDTQEGDGDADD